MRDCVAALIITPQHILLGLRAPERALYPSVWDVFGGHVEPGETHEQTLQRELEEELGIVPTAWRFLTAVDEPDAERYGQRRYHFYVVSAWRGAPANLQPEEHSEIAWHSFEQAQKLPLAYHEYADWFARLAGV